MRSFATREQAELHIMTVIAEALQKDGIALSDYSHIDPQLRNVILRANITDKWGEKKQISITIE
jgi:uncharacterized protein YabE (DUF348 family)